MLCSETVIGSINPYMMIIWVDSSNYLLGFARLSGSHIIGTYIMIGRYGVHLNRTIEEGAAHKNYFVEWGPRRNRLTHNLVF